jgi:endonuclease/exonuclease/phosphatase family metal-dependent hydrolase
MAGCGTFPTDTEPLRLRVLTYNIHHGRGADGVIDLQRLADIIQQAKPDLVALQEVDVKTKRSNGVDQAAKLGELTGMHDFFAEAIPYQGGQYGNAVLSRYPIQAQYRQRLQAEPGQEKRAVAVASVEPWDAIDMRLVFASTHLCHLSEQTRQQQLRAIESNRAYQGSATLLAGDFNFTPDSDEYEIAINAGWLDTAAAFSNPQPTVPADQPTRRIDYVFARPAKRWRVMDVQVLDEPVASDHAPVLVELEYIQP